MRVRTLTLYGALEILVGVVAITSSTSHEIGQFAQSEKSIALILAVLGGSLHSGPWFRQRRQINNQLRPCLLHGTRARRSVPVGVKQSKSRQILANAEANPSNPVVMSVHGQFEGTCCGLKPMSSHQDVLDVGFEVTIVHDGKEESGILVDERYPKVVNHADTRFPVAGLHLDLRQAFAEQLCPAGKGRALRDSRKKVSSCLKAHKSPRSSDPVASRLGPSGPSESLVRISSRQSPSVTKRIGPAEQKRCGPSNHRSLLAQKLATLFKPKTITFVF